MRTREQEKACGRTINMKVSMLARTLGKTWTTLWPKVRRYEERKDIGRALSPEEEQRLLMAAAKSKSATILVFVRVLLLTAMRCGELSVNDLEAGGLRAAHHNCGPRQDIIRHWPSDSDKSGIDALDGRPRQVVHQQVWCNDSRSLLVSFRDECPEGPNPANAYCKEGVEHCAEGRQGNVQAA
jgi:hypothetical protein